MCLAPFRIFREGVLFEAACFEDKYSKDCIKINLFRRINPHSRVENEESGLFYLDSSSKCDRIIFK